MAWRFGLASQLEQSIEPGREQGPIITITFSEPRKKGDKDDETADLGS
jgi:hypothetical protein